MKKVYICHEFGGIYDNVKKIVEYINKLVTYDDKVVYISPVLLFGNLYDTIPYDLSIEYCKSVLKDCDMMITFGDESNSTGCMIEKEFCKEHNIEVIDYIDYFKLCMK